MKIIKKLNNNAAMAQDGKGRELIVFGKGVGFPQTPYELEDLSLIERTFYNVQPRYLGLLEELPPEILFIAADFADTAADELDCALNPSLPFVLADHLNFAIERSRNGAVIKPPFSYDVEHLYPQEYALGRRVLARIRDELEVALPEGEAASVALHFINAEAETDDMHSTLVSAQIISEISEIVENSLGFTLGRESFSYSRFAMHLRYLVQRMMSGTPTRDTGETSELFRTACREYPEVYACMQDVIKYLADKWGWSCTKEEQLYLMMHIHRVRAE